MGNELRAVFSGPQQQSQEEWLPQTVGERAGNASGRVRDVIQLAGNAEVQCCMCRIACASALYTEHSPSPAAPHQLPGAPAVQRGQQRLQLSSAAQHAPAALLALLPLALLDQHGGLLASHAPPVATEVAVQAQGGPAGVWQTSMS